MCFGNQKKEKCYFEIIMNLREQSGKASHFGNQSYSNPAFWQSIGKNVKTLLVCIEIISYLHDQ